MGFRFQKRIKILPGVWINLSKSGISTSFGVKGFTVNLRGDKVRTTASLPGTGISYSHTEHIGEAVKQPTSTPSNPDTTLNIVFWLLLVAGVAGAFLLLR